MSSCFFLNERLDKCPNEKYVCPKEKHMKHWFRLMLALKRVEERQKAKGIPEEERYTTQAELADQECLGMGAGEYDRVIEIARLGLIECRWGKFGDRRKKYIRLTEKGKRCLRCYEHVLYGRSNEIYSTAAKPNDNCLIYTMIS